MNAVYNLSAFKSSRTIRALISAYIFFLMVVSFSRCLYLHISLLMFPSVGYISIHAVLVFPPILYLDPVCWG
ncbi:hypothetical protein M407DRAFT_189778 [Tulasnella calospora MUT 4182]|uniref:Uncharacterized protein n=1 Tax=Tulasnella calospora MUT 4182 TaxID=1051891 RepID=A0A0C3Q239_9AGAM|nr:hypothetical protein M407DRAFT_189778 [Tulasnella calospora MUT 4182]